MAERAGSGAETVRDVSLRPAAGGMELAEPLATRTLSAAGVRARTSPEFSRALERAATEWWIVHGKPCPPCGSFFLTETRPGLPQKGDPHRLKIELAGGFPHDRPPVG
jgi:hypothetical protein